MLLNCILFHLFQRSSVSAKLQNVMQIRKSLELPLIFFIVGIFVMYTFWLLCPFKRPVGLMATSTIRVDKTPSRCPLDHGIPGLTSATLRTWTSVHVQLLCFDSWCLMAADQLLCSGATLRVSNQTFCSINNAAAPWIPWRT